MWKLGVIPLNNNPPNVTAIIGAITKQIKINLKHTNKAINVIVIIGSKPTTYLSDTKQREQISNAQTKHSQPYKSNQRDKNKTSHRYKSNQFYRIFVLSGRVRGSSNASP